MTDFHAVYYRDQDGREPVRDFIDALDEEGQAVLHNQIDRLNLLNAKIPARDIAFARVRWDDFKARMDAKPRVPPRAAGRDAP